MSRSPACFYTGADYRPEESVGYLMRRVLNMVSQEADRRLGEHELTNAQWAPLYKLRAGHVNTVAELARELQVDTGAMTRMLDRLEAKGLCKRVRSTVDRRVVHLELTPAGRRVADKVPAVLADVLNECLAGFSKAEWTTLKDSLRRMLANAEAMRQESADD
ncbi:MarR family winged helix-turn-helix transcriptional regulator [Caldimonas sp. KR1-144]|uniref:MarR family winged helix-turn-helix transcriptional regulator n=1 Tax=Caldimonas sp. KR1-144 TaxID=3400911 RepID=UPI003C10C5CF